MAPGNNWIQRSTGCAQTWKQPRWRLQLLETHGSWVQATLPRIVPAAIALSSVMSHAVSTASAHLPAGHGT